MLFVKCALVLCVAVAASGFNLLPTDCEFHLFTRDNPTISYPLVNTQESLLGSTLSLSRRTVVTIHNFKEFVGSNFNSFVVSAHLYAEDVNVIAVDWSRATTSQYTPGIANAPQAGEMIGQLVNLIISSFSYSPSMVRIVGIGHGAHVAGIAARYIGGVDHIVALDPTLVGWTSNSHKLSADDARVVEVIHTTAGQSGYGYDRPLGDIDFYPNGGTYQAGCADMDCSYMYSYIFYAESLRTEFEEGASRFVGTACESYEQAIAMACEGERDAVFGGTAVKSSESGIYVFRTNLVQPFAQG